MTINDITQAIIGGAIEVDRGLGPGLLESAYLEYLCRELTLRNIPFVRELPLPIEYKDTRLECGYRVDLFVADVVVVEVKAVVRWMEGLLINFNVPVLKEGVRQRVLGLVE